MKKLSQLFIFACFLSCGVFAQTSSNNKLSILHIDANDFPHITISFKAEQQNGLPVWDLSRNSVRVKENEKPCFISGLRTVANSKPIYLSLVVDHSGSMDEDHAQLYDKDGKPRFTIDSDDNMVVPDDYTSLIDNAKKAIKQFASGFDSRKDFISFTAFGTKVDQPLALTHNQEEVNKKIDNMEAAGKTALYDGMLAGIRELKNGYGIKVLVVLTDGQDNTSDSKPEEVIAEAQKDNIPVYIIGLGDVSQATLQEISKETNGQFFYTSNSNSLESIYSTISQRLQAIYEVEYTSTDMDMSKNTREVTLLTTTRKTNAETKGQYTLPQGATASSTAAGTGNTNSTNASSIATNRILTASRLSKPHVVQAAVSEGTDLNLLVYGNIILAGLAAAGILVYRRKKQTRKSIQHHVA